MITLTRELNEKFSWLHRLGEGYLRSIILVVSTILVIGYSVWQGMFNLDPHHWGLMLSNAKDLASGALPYKDIFIQYGLLTTLVHCFGYLYIGNDLRTLIGLTAFFICLAYLPFIFYLCRLRKIKL